MGTRTLLEKIEALPPDKRAELENFVDSLASRTSSNVAGKGAPANTFSDELLRRIDERRERLRREYGLFDSTSVIRELREHGT